jgi:hypothetical protein
MASLGSSSYGLQKDRERKIAAGVGYRPDLGARAAVAHSGMEVDPIGSKKILSEVCDAAYIQAGGNAGANYGTAQHAVFEQFFLHGVPLEKLAPYFHDDIKAVAAALEFHQLRILPQYIERVVYSILYNRGGKIDCIVEHIPTGDLYVLDLKTGEDPIGHPENIVIQLAYYGNADCIFNYDTGQWEPMPKVRTDVALVVHVRPGKGAETDISKCILRFPINVGLAGVHAVETMRAWRQTPIVVTPFISDANWTPPAPVNTNGDVAVANGIIPATIADPAPGPVFSGMVSGQPQPVNEWQAQNSSQEAPMPNGIIQPTQPQADPEQVIKSVAPYASSGSALVGAIVDQAIASGQQLNTEQVAELNRQAAEALSQKQHPRQGNSGLPPAPNQPPGQPVVGPGTPHTVHAGIDSQVSPDEKPEGVPDTRPPAPKSALDKMSPAEHLKELLEVPPGGVDPEAEILDLAQLPKPRLQELIYLASGQTIPMDSPDLKRHKKPLAEMLVPLLNKQREMSGRAPVGNVQQPEVVSEVAASTNGVIDLTFEGVIKAINESKSTDRLNAIYNQVIAAYGSNGWHPDFNTAATSKYNELTHS